MSEHDEDSPPTPWNAVGCIGIMAMIAVMVVAICWYNIERNRSIAEMVKSGADRPTIACAQGNQMACTEKQK